jgi:hypothetical protein
MSTIYVGDGKGGLKEVLATPVLVGDGHGGLKLTREPKWLQERNEKQAEAEDD